MSLTRVRDKKKKKKKERKKETLDRNVNSTPSTKTTDVYFSAIAKVRRGRVRMQSKETKQQIHTYSQQNALW